jgi:hypothetical protein
LIPEITLENLAFNSVSLLPSNLLLKAVSLAVDGNSPPKKGFRNLGMLVRDLGKSARIRT